MLSREALNDNVSRMNNKINEPKAGNFKEYTFQIKRIMNTIIRTFLLSAYCATGMQKMQDGKNEHSIKIRSGTF